MGVTVGADRICLKAYAAERFDEWRHFPTRTVGAAEPPTGRLVVAPPQLADAIHRTAQFQDVRAAGSRPTDKNNKEEPV